MDNPGNEKADEEAKKAAKEKLTGENPLIHRKLKSAQTRKDKHRHDDRKDSMESLNNKRKSTSENKQTPEAKKRGGRGCASWSGGEE